jgi:hypothetical protein
MGSNDCARQLCSTNTAKGNRIGIEITDATGVKECLGNTGLPTAGFIEL